MCKICGSHSVVAEDPILLGCDIVLLSGYFPGFRSISVFTFRVKYFKMNSGAKDEGTTILRNDSNYSQNNTASHPRRL